MKRLLATALFALLAAGGLASCADGGDDPVVTVNGTEVMTEDELEDLLAEVGDADDLLAAQGARGAGHETIRRTWVSSSVLYYVVQSELLRQELADAEVETDEDAAAAADVILADLLANPQDGTQPVTVDQVPGRLRDVYRTYAVRFSAQLESLGADLAEIIDYDPQTSELSEGTVAALQQANDQLAELRTDADVEIAPEWGRWVETEFGPQVAPPEGADTSTTTTPLVPAG